MIAQPGTSDKQEAHRERIVDFLETRLSQMHSYHDHKEKMAQAHAALLVQLALVAAVVGIDQWPPSWVPGTDIVARMSSLAAATLVWLLIHIYIRWQLRNRRVAALYVTALLSTLRRWAHEPPTEEDLRPYLPKEKSSSQVVFLDYLIPRKWAPVPTDEGLAGYPKAMVDEYLGSRTGALTGESLVTYGSLALYLILLVRAMN